MYYLRSVASAEEILQEFSSGEQSVPVPDSGHGT
jgi:hypothetical protein